MKSKYLISMVLSLLILISVNEINTCSAQKYEAVATYANWTTIDIPGLMRFQIPPTMEVQSEGYKKRTEQVGGTAYEFMKDFKKYSQFQFVANQNGLNAGTAYGLGHFSRVTTSLIPASGAFGQDGKINLTKSELLDLKPVLEEMTKESLNIDHRWHFTMNYFTPISVRNISGRDCLMYGYIRTMNNKPPVIVRTFAFYGKQHDLNFTIFYRINERNIWEYPGNDMRDIPNTLYFYGDL